jgi:hypothetical protein
VTAAGDPPAIGPGELVGPRVEHLPWSRPVHAGAGSDRINAWRRAVDTQHAAARAAVLRAADPGPPEPGISVVVTAHRGSERLDRCLAAFAAQTLDHRLVELVVVLGTPPAPAGTTPEFADEAVRRFRATHPSIRLRVVRLASA